MHVLLFASNFHPEIGSSAQIYCDLAKTYAKHGHEVDVITSYPRKYTLSREFQDQEYPLEETIAGIHIHRVKHLSNRDNILVRGLEHFYLPLYYFRAYKKLVKSGANKIDACLLHIPPLPFYYLTRMVKRYDGTPSILNIEDFHPQELTDVVFLKNPIVIRLLKHIEKQAYTKADYITVHSPGGFDYVVSRDADPKRVEVVFNSVDLDVVDDTEIKDDFKVKEGIESKFLVTYAGILSPFQGLDKILDTAKNLLDHSDIQFYIVGDGMEKHHLEQRIADEKLSNVALRTFIPRSDYLCLVKSSDISLISLDYRMKAPCLPGKIINLMAVRQPILAMVFGDSETAKVVTEAKCGVVVDSPDDQVIVDAILSLKDNAGKRKLFGENGRVYLEEHMNTEVAVKQYERIIRKYFI